MNIQSSHRASHGTAARTAMNIVTAGLMALLCACSANDVTSVTAPVSAESDPVPAIVAERSEAMRLKLAEREALKLANHAYQSNRIATPPGDNALEHALHAKEINATSIGADELLTDIMPMVTTQVQAKIAAGNLSEANRVIELLDRANPESLTTMSLRRRLERASGVALASN